MVNSINDNTNNKNFPDPQKKSSETTDKIYREVIRFYERNASKMSDEAKKKYEETFPEAIKKYKESQKSEEKIDLKELSKIDFMKDVYPNLTKEQQQKIDKLKSLEIKT